MAETRTRMQRAKGYDPELITVPPIFQRPARPVEMLRWLITKYMWPQSSLWIAISVIVFHFATPDVSRFASLSGGDIVALYESIMLRQVRGLNARTNPFEGRHPISHQRNSIAHFDASEAIAPRPAWRRPAVLAMRPLILLFHSCGAT